jgi:hypothetical protein
MELRSVCLSLAWLSLVLFSDAAAAQQTSLKQQLVGAWTFVRTEATQADGRKILPFGPDPKGIVIFTEDGQFAHMQIADGIAKFASNSRVSGTAEENRAVVQGSIALFGTYTVEESTRTIIRRIESGTFPNWVGQEQRVQIDTLTANELVYSNSTGSIAGAKTVNFWKRAK